MRTPHARLVVFPAGIRLLARHIVEQRGEVEQYFLEALDEIRSEIVRNRVKFAKESKDTQQRQVGGYL